MSNEHAIESSSVDYTDGVVRYGTPEAEDYNAHGNSEIVYPNSWTVPDGVEHHAPNVFEEHPSLFYRGRIPTKRTMAEKWQAITVTANPNPIMALSPNPKRCQVTIYVPSTNTGLVFLSPTMSGSNGAGSDSVALRSDSDPVVLKHSGPIVVSAATAQTVYLIEESYA
jgi:hypothetical protein